MSPFRASAKVHKPFLPLARRSGFVTRLRQDQSARKSRDRSARTKKRGVSGRHAVAEFAEHWPRFGVRAATIGPIGYYYDVYEISEELTRQRPSSIARQIEFVVFR